MEQLGEIRMTAGVFESYQSDIDFSFFVDNCLERYLSGDWGDLDEDDKKLNNAAILNGDDRILAAYNFSNPSFTSKDNKIWIFTEGDRSVTTILFPSEY